MQTASSRTRPKLGLVTALIPLILLAAASLVLAQEADFPSPSPGWQQGAPTVSPGELSNLVAPVALYPDPLLSQVLVASAYPLELVEAGRWLEQNRGLQGPQLMSAAQQQDWDASVQALVAFPNVLALLTSNIRWTTSLGQAFLAQPADVMNAIQWLRDQARDNGQLANTPEFSIDTQVASGESAIQIEPADPQMMYVPAYNPADVWGPPAAGYYPDLPYQGSGFGSLLSSAINLASMFSGFSGLLEMNSWGWAIGWLARTLFINNSFLSNFGFRGGSGGYGGANLWAHNTARVGAPYAPNGPSGPNGDGWRPNGNAWQPFGGSRGSFGISGAGFSPGRSAGDSNFQGRPWTSNIGGWRNFGSSMRPGNSQGLGAFARPASWTGRRDPQSLTRFEANSYRPGRASYANAFANWRSHPIGAGGLSAPQVQANRFPRAGFTPSRSFSHGGGFGRSSGFREPRLKSGHNSFRHSSGNSWKPPKQPHFRAPHFSAPHFKSHGSGHSSHGHLGGKHRR